MVVPPPRRRDISPGRDNRKLSRAATAPKEFRLSRTTIRWLKRAALLVGIVLAVLLTVALLKAVYTGITIPKIDNPLLDAAVDGQ